MPLTMHHELFCSRKARTICVLERNAQKEQLVAIDKT